MDAVGSRLVSLRPRPKKASALGSSVPSELTHWIVNGGCIWAKPSKGGFEHEVTNLSRSAVSCRHMHRGDGERGGRGGRGGGSRQEPTDARHLG